MIDNKKLINILLILLIAYVLYLMSDLWLGVFLKIMVVLNPFIVGFALAYGLSPFLKFLQKKKIPKPLGITIIGVIIFALLAFIIISIVPVFTTELVNLFQGIIKFVNEMDSVFNIDLSSIKTSLVDTFNSVTKSLASDLPNTGMTIVSASLTVVTNLIIALVSFFYFIADMDRIRRKVRLFFKSRTEKTFELVSLIDKNMTSYFKGLFINVVIMFLEYTLLYRLIGHPNFFLLGLIAAFTPLIPYFGGVIMNLIAIVTASVVSPQLLIFSIIIMIVFPQIDGYIIVPKIYGKTNKIPPLLTVFTAFAGGVIGGAVGIIVSLPVTIILLTLFRYYEKEITNKINTLKKDNKA